MDASVRSLAELELKKWLEDVNATITNIEDILQVLQEVTPPFDFWGDSSISYSSTPFLSLDRHFILVELKQRAAIFGLIIDMIDSTDPNQDD